MFDGETLRVLISRVQARRVRTILFAVLPLDILIIAFSTAVFLKELERTLRASSAAESVRGSYSRVMFPRPVKKIADAKDQEVRVEKKPSVPARTAPLESFIRKRANSFGGGADKFYGSEGWCEIDDASQGEGSGGYMKLTYDVSDPFAYSGFWSGLNGFNAGDYRRLAFQVRGGAGNEVFKIELGDGESSSKISIARYLPSGITTRWQQVTIPLKEFSSLKKWREMDGNFAIVFENVQGPPYSGTVYVKDVRFESD